MASKVSLLTVLLLDFQLIVELGVVASFFRFSSSTRIFRSLMVSGDCEVPAATFSRFLDFFVFGFPEFLVFLRQFLVLLLGRAPRRVGSLPCHRLGMIQSALAFVISPTRAITAGSFWNSSLMRASSCSSTCCDCCAFSSSLARFAACLTSRADLDLDQIEVGRDHLVDDLLDTLCREAAERRLRRSSSLFDALRLSMGLATSTCAFLVQCL